MLGIGTGLRWPRHLDERSNSTYTHFVPAKRNPTFPSVSSSALVFIFILYFTSSVMIKKKKRVYSEIAVFYHTEGR